MEKDFPQGCEKSFFYFKFGFIELFERVKMPMTVNSPTACGRSPLGEGALERGAKLLIG